MSITYTPQSRIKWPVGQPRTKNPIKAQFKVESVNDNLFLVCNEIDRIGGTNIVIQSEMPIGRSGSIIQGWKQGDDHRVAVHWTKGGRPYVLAIDRFDHPVDNLRAIGLSLEAIRALSRWGGDHLTAQTHNAFAQLPPPKVWRDVLGNCSSLDSAESAYRTLSKTAHPDKGGSDDKMSELNNAILEARKEFK